MNQVLEISDLTVEIGTLSPRTVLDSVSISVAEGEVVALVGESGSGKSMTALSVVSLLPASARRSATTLRVAGVDVTTNREKELDSIRGGLVGMLFQQPKRMLDPTSTIGTQVAEPLRLHLGLSRSEARRRVPELLRGVGITDPERRMSDYPHQLSGGIAQRVMIAAALAAEPKLLIADEPTTALDATIEAQILRLIEAKRRQLGMSVLFISHDLRVVASIADRIAVMYAGRIVEQGTAEQVMQRPCHPYTDALIRASLLVTDEDGQFFEITGNPMEAGPDSDHWQYAPRCSHPGVDAEHACTPEHPRLEDLPDDPGHLVRCWPPATLNESKEAV